MGSQLHRWRGVENVGIVCSKDDKNTKISNLPWRTEPFDQVLTRTHIYSAPLNIVLPEE